MSDSFFLPPHVKAYVSSQIIRESGPARRLREYTHSLPQARMQISADEGAFLALLVKLMGARRILEVGTFTGYSALCMAQAMPPGGRLVACDRSKAWTDVAQRYWQEAGVENRIELRLGEALATLQALLAEGGEGVFDMAFIDADKGNYDAYYELCLRLVRKGGLIALDNMLWRGHVADPSEQEGDTLALRALNTKIQADSRVDMSLLSVADGVMLAVKR